MSLNRKTATGREMLASLGGNVINGAEMQHYSEEERIIGYWTDGKPLYRKVFNVNSPNIVDQNTNVITPTDFNFDVIDEIVNIYGKLIFRVGNSEFVYPLNMSNYNGVSISCWYRTKDNGIGMNIHSNSDLLNQPTTIILEYTKTTDQPITNNNTYSTDEVLTGKTWIDGKPIYRKVVDFGVLPNASSKTVSANIPNIDKVIKIDAMRHRASDNGNSLLPYLTYDMTNLNLSVSIFNAEDDITIVTFSDRSNETATVIIEYTKSTD